jgi:uncharacterized protein YuzE
MTDDAPPPLPPPPFRRTQCLAMSDRRLPIVYDPETDSMYVSVRGSVGVDSRVDDKRDLVIDLDELGRPVGYDIQFASRHPDVIAEALQALRHALDDREQTSA